MRAVCVCGWVGEVPDDPAAARAFYAEHNTTGDHLEAIAQRQPHKVELLGGPADGAIRVCPGRPPQMLCVAHPERPGRDTVIGTYIDTGRVTDDGHLLYLLQAEEEQP